MKTKTLNLTSAALIAAMYVVLTFVANMLGLASGAIQIRLSEMLTILPVFTWAAVPGLAVGCVLANILTGCALWDIVFGSLATLIGALGTYFVGRKKPALGPVFPIMSNALIVPLILQHVYGLKDGYFYLMATVGIGEIIACGLLGWVLYKVLEKRNIFKNVIS